jgi:hypothetical protein
MKLKIISDGTNAGTKLIDEDTGKMVHLIQKLSWEANAKEPFAKVTVELINIPVEITSKAEVELLDYNKDNWELEVSKTFEKEIKIISKAAKVNQFNLHTTVHDVQTNEQVGAIQEIKWEATPSEVKAKVKRIKFDKKDW